MRLTSWLTERPANLPAENLSDPVPPGACMGGRDQAVVGLQTALAVRRPDHIGLGAMSVAGGVSRWRLVQKRIATRSQSSQSIEALCAAKISSEMVYIPNLQPLLREIETNESQLRAQQTEWSQVLSRLDGLEVSDTTKAMFQRFVNGELTIKELSTAIDEYVNLKGKSVTPSGNGEA